MASLRTLFVLPAVCAAVFVVLPAFGAKADLQRMQPVPADQQIPIADFFRPAVLDGPAISPNGMLIAARLTKEKELHTLIVYHTDSQKTDVVSSRGDRDVYNHGWLDDSHLYFSLSLEKKWGVGFFAAEVTGHDVRTYPITQYLGTNVIGINDRDRLHPLVWNRFDEESVRGGGVAQVDAGVAVGEFIDLTGATAGSSASMEVRKYNRRHITKRFPDLETNGVVTGYYCDKDANLAFASTALDGVESLYRFDGAKWIKCPIDLDQYRFLTVGNHPNEIVVQHHGENGKPAPVQFMDASTGTPGAVLMQENAYDFDGWFYRDNTTHELIGAVYFGSGPAVKWFRDEEAEIQNLLNGSFEPGQIVQIVSRSLVGHRYVVRRFSDRQPSIYDWVDLDKHAAGPIKSTMPWIDPKRMRPMQVMQFKTRDGHVLDAYLTLPSGTSKEHPAPLIVLPHGGPYVRDHWGFNGEVQYFASRGYAVLQPNYRGSTSYDCRYPEADRWDFEKMHEDVTDAAKAAIATKLIDRDRIAIVGGSFGGYQAIAGVSGDPELYRCAVTIAGVFDWSAMVAEAKYSQYSNGQYGWFLRRLGDPTKDKDKFSAISPLNRVGQIRVPVFVAHGTEDLIVRIEQSKALISELEKHHVPFEKLIAGSEGHGMQHVDKQVELYSRIEEFLAKNMTPRSAPTTAAAASAP